MPIKQNKVTHFSQKRRYSKSNTIRSTQKPGSYNVIRNTKLQIKHRKSLKKSDSASTDKTEECEMEDDAENKATEKIEMDEEKENIPDKDEFTVVDLQTRNEIITIPLSNETLTTVPGKSEFFEKITEKAAKFVPKRSSFGKLFGDKQSDIHIYTIDQEMRKTKQENNARQLMDKTSEAYLMEKLKKTRKSSDFNDNGKYDARFKSVKSQAMEFPPYRLYFLPKYEWNEWSEGYKLATVLRLITCQAFLMIFIILWTFFGSILLCLSEGYYELNQVNATKEQQDLLTISLKTELRLLDPMNDTWIFTIDRYIEKHEKLITGAIKSGYSKDGHVWNYSGCLLYSTSLITFLGYGLPKPATVTGRIGSVIFTLIGLPINYVFLLNCGLLLSLKIQLMAKSMETKIRRMHKHISNLRKFGENRREREKWPDDLFLIDFKPPEWLQYFTILYILLYYVAGIIIFGSIRPSYNHPTLFFIDFINSSTLSNIYGITKIGFSFYIELFALLLMVNIGLLRVPKLISIVTPAIELGLVTNELLD